MAKKHLKTSKKKALIKAQNLCAGQEKCIYDIKQKFYQWGVNNDDFDDLIKSLTDDGFINEERYATAFTKEKFRFNKWGKVKIEFALKQKNIPDQFIKNALQEIPLQDYDAVLEKELIKKKKSLKDTDPYVIKTKLVRFAVSKGFENGKIFDMVNSMIEKSKDD
ncbi:MAG: RecX family transcriptional regulator [Bacteroidales bacterium]